MMQKSEKVILALIFGIMGIHVVAQVIVPTVNSQIVEMKPVPAVTIAHQNMTSERTVPDGPEPPVPAEVEHSMVVPERPSISSVLGWSLNDLGFALLVTFAGVGLWLPWGGVMVGQFPEDPSVLAPLLFFWLSSMASVPIMLLRLSKKIPWWRLGAYLYLVPVLVGGVGIVYFTRFGA